MANEITVTGKLRYSKSSGVIEDGTVNLSVDVTGTNALKHIQSIGTSEEAIALGEVTPGGWCYIANLDSTNFVSIRQATGAADLIRIKAGEFALFRMDADATAPFIIADTASCDVLIILVED